MNPATIQRILDFGNLVLSSVNVIIGFSLFAYVLAHNYKSAVARAYCALMAFLTAIFLVDVSITQVDSLAAANPWLRFQWLGIVFVPAAYYHFSDALLRTTGSSSRWRRAFVAFLYVIGVSSLGLVVLTDVIVIGVAKQRHIFHLMAGPGFWVFVLYYVLASIAGWFNISRARARCLTTTSRRRMSYLMLAFAAPAAGVFPYLLISTTYQTFSVPLITLTTLIANMAIALMTVVMGYIVAYQGILLPDRVIKHRIMHYLLRGPLVSILVIVIMLIIPQVELVLGLPRDALMIVLVAGSVVVLQLFVDVAKPALDRLIYRRDRDEITWFQAVDQRLLTSTDIEQLLENTLIAICDLLQTPSGFVVTMQNEELAIRVFCGPIRAARVFLARSSVPGLLESMAHSRKGQFVSEGDFVTADGHWLLPLNSQTGDVTLGILGIWATTPAPSFSDEDLGTLYGLVRRAELALEDVRFQQQLFGVLQGMNRELDRMQEWRSMPLHRGEHVIQHIEASPVQSPGFARIVKDALSQFWGGPKLSQSPLLRTHIVRERLSDNDNVPAKAVRETLNEAIERLRPSGDRSMIAGDWTVYNILDLRFVQGKRIRDVATQLAMSESDYYRKQRVAIQQLAETLARMEREESGTSSTF